MSLNSLMKSMPKEEVQNVLHLGTAGATNQAAQKCQFSKQNVSFNDTIQCNDGSNT